MSRTLSHIVGWLFCGGLAMAQGHLVAGVHEDARLGYRLKVPDKWTSVPLGLDEKWVVAKYVCPRIYEGKLAATACKPELRVVCFTPDKIKRAEATAAAGDTPDAGKVRVFHNYKEWFRANVRPGLAYTIEAEKPETIGEASFTRFDIITSARGQKVIRYVCAVYERKSDSTTIAVEFSQLDDYYKNLQGDFDKSLESFRFAEVAAAAAGADAKDEEADAPLWTQDRARWRELPKTERARIRQAVEAKRKARILAQVPEGWSTLESKSKRFVALAHVDKKYAAAVLDKADAIWDWLETRFGAVSDEYPTTGAIQLCKDLEEATAHGFQIPAWDEYCSDNREIVDCKDSEAGLQRTLTVRYLVDKDPYASFAPPWFVFAVANYLATAEVDGKKLAFKSDTWEKTQIKDAQRTGGLRTLHELITSPSDEWPTRGAAEDHQRAHYCALIRFLDSKEAERVKGLERFLPRYAAAVIKAGEQWRKEHPAAAEALPEVQTEAQVVDAIRNKAKAFKEREKFMIETVTKDVANFAQKDWATIEAAWKKWLTK